MDLTICSIFFVHCRMLQMVQMMVGGQPAPLGTEWVSGGWSNLRSCTYLYEFLCLSQCCVTKFKPLSFGHQVKAVHQNQQK